MSEWNNAMDAAAAAIEQAAKDYAEKWEKLVVSQFESGS